MRHAVGECICTNADRLHALWRRMARQVEIPATDPADWPLRTRRRYDDVADLQVLDTHFAGLGEDMRAAQIADRLAIRYRVEW